MSAPARPQGAGHETNSAVSGTGLAGAAVAVTAWGTSSIIAKWLPMGALAIAAYRFAAYALISGGARAARGQSLSAHAFRRSLRGGVLLAVDVALFFTALKLTSVVNATIIGSLQPLLLTAYGVRFLSERVTRRDMFLGLVALAGAIVIVARGADTAGSNLWGNLAAVGALLCWSAYFIEAKRVSAEISPADFTISGAICVAAVNAPLALVFGQSLGWPGWDSFSWILAMALGAGILGHNLMNWSIVRIPLWLGSTFTLCVPVVSSALAWAFLDEPLTAVQILAMVTTVAALALLVWFQTASQDPS